ncbi:MAG: sigma-54-dependent transcriptional regulator [Acidobacteriota bacterium]
MELKERILIVDDNRESLRKMYRFLADNKYDVLCLPTIKDAQQLLEKEPCDLLILKEELPDGSGLELLRQVKKKEWQMEVILINHHGTTSSAVRAIKEGAFDYLIPPLPKEKILLAAKSALEHRQLLAERDYFHTQLLRQYSYDNIVGKSPPMQKVFELIEKVARTNTTVLIVGESGTGKELVARAIHYHSMRRDKRFLTINCSAIPDELLESELFGYEKGAFTDAVRPKKGLLLEANQGTVFFDEIGELPPNLQVKLLRVLQEKELKPLGSARTLKVDLRVISATNKDLEEEVKRGRFREDLYYRINVLTIHLPPLRQRPEDIPLLADFFLSHYSRETGKRIKTISPELTQFLLNYPWPGNVRELENMIEKGVILAEGDTLRLKDLSHQIGGEGFSFDQLDETLFLRPYNEARKITLDNFSSEYIKRALIRHKGNVTRAALAIGIKRQSLHHIMKRLRIKASDYK